ncbi:MAG: GntR family transcriptional regulator [Acidimicrobiia bacterium]|nr:GntR family transcriptional regulator [Acidimicrobiia bacterium]
MRQIRYRQIAETIRRQIESGRLSPGQVLPSEASLGAEHGVSRVTIRKSLEQLRADGLVESRQGFGWMVASQPVVQTLDTLVSIERQLARTGRTHERRILDFRFIDSPPPVKPVLGNRVLEVRRVSLVDGEPFGRVTVWCREDLGAGLSRDEVAQSSFYELLSERAAEATQTIGAEIVSETDARLLQVPPGSAVLVVRRTTIGESGQAMLMAEHSFPGHLTEFVAQLPRTRVDDSDNEAGLRLVDEAG